MHPVKEASASQARPGAYIVYDGECPFCSAYVRHLRLQHALGTVCLVDARSPHPVVDRLKADGHDLDEGMALVIGERAYVGHECITMLALLTTRSGIFNRLSGFLFSSRRVSRIAYPLLRAGRNLALRLLGRPRIR
jgi:predicted DCC family thiol-disulfide oxidoreductase YuxK